MPTTKATETAVSSTAETKSEIGSRGKKMAMIKGIKITAENAGAIELALRAENGWNTAHTFTTFDQIEELAARAERELESLGIAKTLRLGAVYDAVSARVVSKRYRVITIVQLLRKAAGWFLVAVATDTVSAQGYRGCTGLTLTAEQDARAVAVFRKNYHTAE